MNDDVTLYRLLTHYQKLSTSRKLHIPAKLIERAVTIKLIQHQKDNNLQEQLQAAHQHFQNRNLHCNGPA